MYKFSPNFWGSSFFERSCITSFFKLLSLAITLVVFKVIEALHLWFDEHCLIVSSLLLFFDSSLFMFSHYHLFWYLPSLLYFSASHLPIFPLPFSLRSCHYITKVAVCSLLHRGDWVVIHDLWLSIVALNLNVWWSC